MLSHYLKIAYRNAIKNKSFAFINITGLAIGMTCCVMIMLWVQDEMSINRFHSNIDDLHMVINYARHGDDVSPNSTTAPALAPVLEKEYPEIVRASRYNGTGILILSHGDKVYQEFGYAVDEGFLEMFSFPMVKGDSTVVLSEPHSIVMTEEMAAKYFGEEDPIGKVVLVRNKHALTVTGIIQKPPLNSTMRFDFLIPFVALEDIWESPNYPESWTNWNTRIFVQLQKGADHEEVSGIIANRLYEATDHVWCRLVLRPYGDLYLYGIAAVGGRIGGVILFSLIALAILLIACVNFMNTATARSVGRAREVGLRKVAGAFKRNIIGQFYCESYLLSFVSLVFAIALVEFTLPLLNELSGKSLVFNFSSDPRFWLGLLGVVFVTGFIAGSYPALYMSSFMPVRIFTGMAGSGHKKPGFRKSFVVWQFGVSIVLMITTLVIHKQLSFVQEIPLGFERENLVYIPLQGAMKNQYEAVKQEVLKNPDILSVSLTSRVPTGVYDNGSGWQWENISQATNPLVTYYMSDVDFLVTFKTEMVQGRFFSQDRAGVASFESGEIIINEKLAGIIGAENPVGMRVSNYDTDYTIIGVIKNFHFKPLDRQIEPMILFQKSYHANHPNKFNFLFAKIRPNSIESARSHVETVCDDFSPGYPFSLRFIDDDYYWLYNSMRRTGTIFEYAVGLMILISCLGLFGLAAFTTEQRTREIGIRKVLGASVTNIIRLLCKDILTPVIIACAIAWVISFFLMKSWLLASFAYSTALGWEPFIIAGLIALLLAVLPVSVQAFIAAQTNPVDTLRHE